MFFGTNDAKTETPVLWPSHAKSWLIGKDSDARRDWGQEEKGMTEDEMAGWHHWLNGRESEWTPGVGDWQGGLVCCKSWGHKELDTTEQLNWTEWLMTLNIFSCAYFCHCYYIFFQKMSSNYLLSFVFFKYLFIWECWVFDAAHGIWGVACGILPVVCRLQSTANSVISVVVERRLSHPRHMGS